MAQIDRCADPVPEDVLALSAAFEFIDSNRDLFIEFVRGWYDPDMAASILAACRERGILRDGPG